MKSRKNTIAVLVLVAFLIPCGVDAATLGYWRFEEGVSGSPATIAGSVLDSIGSNHGNPSGGPIYASDVPVTPVPQNGLVNSLSLGFDGSDATVLIPTDAALDSADPFTVEFWVRSSDTRTGQHLLVDKSHGFGDTTGWFFQTEPGTGVIDFGLGNGVGFPALASLTDLFDDEWHFLVGTYDGNQIELFVDGVSQGTKETGVFVSNDRDIRIGSARNNGRFFSGGIDELRISDEVLTPDQFLVVPEPASLGLLALGGLALLRRRK